MLMPEMGTMKIFINPLGTLYVLQICKHLKGNPLHVPFISDCMYDKVPFFLTWISILALS